MKSTAVDESLSSMNQQFCSRENQLLQMLQQNEKSTQKSHKYTLCIIDEVMNFLITVPFFQARSEEIGETLIENVITKFCIPEYIIMDQDSAFMSSLMTYLFHKFSIKIKTVAPL